MNKLGSAYDARVATDTPRDFLRQVGHTEGGTPISDHQLAAMIADLDALLELGPEDHLLDLCCGNGVVTSVLSQRVETCLGLDLSARLIDMAVQYNAPENTRYMQADLMAPGPFPDPWQKPFSKVLMHAALQHFRPRDLTLLLQAILDRCGPSPVIVFGFVPEDGKQRFLLDTPRKRLYRTYLRVTGKDVFGHWWSRRDLEVAARNLGLSCSFHPVDSSLAAASYRFNVRMSATAS